MVDEYNEQRVLAAAHRYAAFDKSDPFALARALCHIRKGLCKRLTFSDGHTEDGHYDAVEHGSVRDGTVYIHYTSVRRP